MKPLKWQEDDPALAQEVRKKGGGDYPPWLDALMSWVDTVIVLIQSFVQ